MEAGKGLQRILQRRPHRGGGPDAPFEVQQVDDKTAVLSIQPRIEAADEPVPGEDRHRVVAVGPLGRWNVDLPGVVKVEEIPDPLTPPQQIVQRRQETDRCARVLLRLRGAPVVAPKPGFVLGEHVIRAAHAVDPQRDHGTGPNQPLHDRTSI